jgi:hypothetical protein
MIVFDLDETLRNNNGCQHTIPADVTVNTNWDNWQRWVNQHGTVIPRVADLYDTLCRSFEYVHIVTRSRFGTEQWLMDNILPVCDYIQEGADDDNRSPFEYKKAYIDENKDEITLWVDDSAEVCDYARSLGINVMQVPTPTTIQPVVHYELDENYTWRHPHYPHFNNENEFGDWCLFNKLSTPYFRPAEEFGSEYLTPERDGDFVVLVHHCEEFGQLAVFVRSLS